MTDERLAEAIRLVKNHESGECISTITRLRSALTARDEAIRAQADKLRTLQPNWDSYGAPVISEKAIEAAVATALAAPHLTPCSSGGVQLDWQAAEVTFGPDGEQEFDAPNARVREAIRVAEEALKRGKLFIDYARYELEPGKAVIGDQFPRQADADEHIALLAAAISALAAAKEQG